MAAAPTSDEPRVLVAALGHAWLSDQAFGLRVLERLRERALPPHVRLADWSFGSIAAFQRLVEYRPARAVFLCAVERGREPGTLHAYRPAAPLPSEDEVHLRIADCVMGAVDLDHLLIMARYYHRLPDDVWVLEAEPALEEWGSELSDALAARMDEVVDWVLAVLRQPGAPPSLPTAGAGGGR